MSRQLPDWIEAYLDYSQNSEAPERFHFWTGVSVLSGALRRKVWIPQGTFSWKPNFYIFLVAPPGVISKSTTADRGMDLLKSIEEDTKIKFGANSTTWQSLVQELAWAKSEFSLAEIPFKMSALTFVASELGMLLKPDDHEMINLLIEMWDAKDNTFLRTTKTAGKDEIVNPCLNILGSTTPNWIAVNVPASMLNSGFISRTIFVYGEEKEKLIAFPGDYYLSEEMLRARDSLRNDLIHIANNIIGPLEMTKEAHDWGVDWYERNDSERKENAATDRYAEIHARKQTQLMKLAMILSISRGDSLKITLSDMQNSLKRINEVYGNLDRVFSHVNATEAKPTNALIDLVHRKKRIKKVEAYRSLHNAMSYDQFLTAVTGGIHGNFIYERNESGTFYLVSSDYERSTNGAEKT